MLVYLNIDGSINQMHKEEAVDKLLAQYDSVSSLYEFHPDMFEDLSKAEMQLLAELFYIGKEMSDDEQYSIDIHLQEKYTQDPDLPQKLNPIIEKIIDTFELPGDAQERLLFKQ